MRGGHAYDVLKRGGSMDLATEVVSKWHFNYTDITSFDRGIKDAIPFWTFYSRNLSLQAFVWSHMPHKLNATYGNLARNLNLGNEPDTAVPQWMTEAGGMQMGDGGDGRNTPYLMPDLPAIQGIEDMANLMEPFNGKLVGNTAPWLKLPFEQFAGKQTFSGIPFKDRYAERGPDGEMVPREAPNWAQIPGIEQILSKVGAVKYTDGGVPVMSDRTQYLAEGAFPLAANVTKLLPNQQKQLDRVGSNWASFLGLGLRYNNDSTRGGERYRQQLAAESRAKLLKDLAVG